VIVGIVWGVVGVVALVVLGFAAYELTWKIARLRRDAQALQTQLGELSDLSRALAEVQQRLPRRG